MFGSGKVMPHLDHMLGDHSSGIKKKNGKSSKQQHFAWDRERTTEAEIKKRKGRGSFALKKPKRGLAISNANKGRRSGLKPF